MFLTEVENLLLKIHCLAQFNVLFLLGVIVLAQLGILLSIHFPWIPQGLSEEEKSQMKRFDIYRANPNDPEDRPKYMTYYIDSKQCGPMILDALIKIKDEIDPTLSFRRSCREGICGSCSMNVDGRHHLACLCAIPKNNEKSVVSPLMFMFLER